MATKPPTRSLSTKLQHLQYCVAHSPAHPGLAGTAASQNGWPSKGFSARFEMPGAAANYGWMDAWTYLCFDVSMYLCIYAFMFLCNSVFLYLCMCVYMYL